MDSVHTLAMYFMDSVLILYLYMWTVYFMDSVHTLVVYMGPCTLWTVCIL